MFYIHPWEYDAQHPKIKLKSNIGSYTHYVKLAKTYNYTKLLLNDFRCTTMKEVIAEKEIIDNVLVVQENDLFNQ